jgi:hypothetical protein
LRHLASTLTSAVADSFTFPLAVSERHIPHIVPSICCLFSWWWRLWVEWDGISETFWFAFSFMV